MSKASRILASFSDEHSTSKSISMVLRAKPACDHRETTHDNIIGAQFIELRS